MNSEIEIIEEVEKEGKNHKELRLLDVTTNKIDSGLLSTHFAKSPVRIERKESTLEDYYRKRAANDLIEET